ncbi:MAG: hypothetical protein JAY99_19895 [Candidatus Thiodiazotropha lotti]|nr:hypothetical protein [Candidatus Thiodiazotropha weberae]MCG7902849.1 hypothetical protein [Candidatus Thiodiazotropha weberae]MCG8001782.1 hypothetical protein [Candidatus Thiodiazotropha lotti]MCW4193556.1 hypothetical protein [Candidatus Thiodiazotropha weberae]
MLRKSKIAAAMLMATATAGVNAAFVNTDGTGQVALLPYYNVNNNILTNINITNTTDLYKVVKVRFRESRISADVLDFNIYMSPYDVWNGTIRLNAASGVANIITEDESCTFPDKALLQAGVDFRNIYDATTDEDLTEGYVEVIEMGTIADGAGPATDGGETAEIDGGAVDADGTITAATNDRSIPAGILHDATGMPADCSVVSDAWTAGAAGINGFTPGTMTTEGIAADANVADPYEAGGINAGLVYTAADRGGINAYAIMINAADGAAFVEQGTHIDAYATVPQHYRSNDPANYLLPSLSSGDVLTAEMLNADATAVKSTGVMSLTEYDTGSVNDITPNPSIPMGSNPFPIAVALSADAVAAPYFTEAGINGGTDIVVTFPMRKHGVYNGGILTNQLDATAAACVGTLNDGVDDGASVAIPNVGTTGNDYPNDGAGTICTNAGFASSTPDVQVSLTYYDYEEQTAAVVAGSDDFSPVPIDAPTVIALEREVNVISVQRNDGSSASVLGTPAANVFNWTLDPGFEAGWVMIGMSNYDYNTDTRIANLTEAVGGINAAGAGVFTGVPAIGFSAMAADVGPAQIGETVDLIRSVNRN